MGRGLEKKIWLYTISIMIIGLIALYSASFENVRVSRQVFYDQLGCAVLGLILMYVISRLDYRHFYDFAYIIYALNVLLLFFVLVSGRHALGARRWIDIAGINFQPSEVTKVAVIFLLARYFSKRRPRFLFDIIGKMEVILMEIIFPLFLVGLSLGLIFKQPDLGTAIVVFGIFVTMLFAGGFKVRYVLGFLGVVVAMVPFGWHFLKGYQKDRLLVFLNPNIDPLGAGYTVIQSKIAVGSGQIFGKGWFAGTQTQLNFLPERHTDFIFSVIGEEWGLVGALTLIYCYYQLINCGLDVARQLKDKFAMLVAVGVVSILILQVVINIGMVMGLFPVVGLTLPLVSYGRTSFLAFTIMIGFLLGLNKRRTVF
ncbi:MAG: rod shape-determining protein RodA [Candidatus Omnitrophica bacterium]|nr:rod shape-determining protein RodA [Candidatus Omnitrophota bacterium]